ncbi:MAG TPA: low-specificity L-threonine aldolase [Blastocatellia bacterium]|nr:low-specificity L-threonine aldolase [Blastocatellia bacterium]
MVIDLRSDTVTRPTPEMRAAMARADVGDDVYGEDPTVNRLQERAAEIFEREAALFVPSGTMGNQICLKVHTRPGQEVIVEERSHIYNYEMSAMAVISGLLPRVITAPDGIPDWPTIERAIRPPSYFRAATGLICLENTHNMAGGTILPVERMEEICARAHERGLPVHLDGARIFNAAVALGRSVAELTRPADSVMFCLSKGLGAPVGSMIVGSRDFIDAAHRVRKMLGGGMRQAGVLAAAGLIALEKMPERLHEDHENARLLAAGLAEIPGIAIDPEKVQTNIVIFSIAATGMTTAEFSARLKERGVLAQGISPTEMRLVTHYDVSRQDCLQALQIIREVLR